MCRRLFICLVTWAVLFTQVNFDLLPIEAALPDVAPSITVSMSYVEGGTVPTDEDGKPVQGTVLVGRNGNNAAIIDLKMDAAFQNGKIHNPYFSINLPYFYLKDGALIETLNIDEVPADQKDADGNPQMGIRATVVDGGSYGVIQGQEFRGQSLLLDQSKPEDPDNKNIINGAPVVITAGSSSTVRLKFDFYGDVPENTTGIASVGGGYLTYEGDTGEIKDYNVYQQNSDQYVFICSNLSWRTNIEQVSHNVMWDKYNYMVYKVSIENVSTDPQSVIDSDQLSIAVPVYEVDQYGVRRKDSRKWLYNAETGEITENTDIDHVNGKMFTGKPGDGGILIYDIDGISEEELSKWDLNTFKNVEEDNIPYYISAETGTFYIQDKEPIKSGEKKEYYFAIPFPRNFRQEDQQFTAQLYGTVYFSNGKYSWTQQDTTASSFEAPNPSFTHRKYVKDSDGAVQNKIQAAIGDNVNYYLDSFKNTGNLPAFNATVTDVLPENFDLRKVSIAMNIRDGKTPSLSDWFASENILSLEIKDGSETKFVPMGSFAEDVDLTTASKKVWSADISSLLQAYLKEHTTAEFTGRIQIHFKERIEVNEQLDGEIIINGDTTVLDNYINTLQTTYEEWLYVQETTTTEETYQKLNKTVTEDSATVEAQPGNPLIKVDTYLQEEGTTDYKEETSVPVYTENTGYRYELGNDSISNIIPAKFSTGELLKKNDEDGQFGFIADSLIFSEKLLQVSDINNVIFYYADGTNQTFTENDFVASSENNKKILVPSGKVLLSATVNFKKVNANLPLSDDVYMLLNGEPNQIGNLDVTGSFETQYNDPDVDKNATDKGTLNVSSINMTLFAKSFYLQEDGTKKESALNQSTSDQTKPTIHSLTVKNKQPNSGYEFEIENRSEAYSRDADILIDLSSSVGNKNTIDDPVVKGFLTQKIDITNINKTAVIRGIYIYDWNESLLMNNPSMVLNGEDLNDVISSDGDTISISQDKLEQYGIKRVHYVRLDLEDYKAQNNTNPEKMKIVLTGVSDWYDDLDAKITFTPDNIYMAQQIRDITGRLHVDRPEMSVQSNLNYYDNVKETTTSLADNDDQNRTQLAIPYDRDFNLHVTLNNKTISVLDNPYITVALPVNDETQGDESHTGFHATKIVLDDGLLTGYEDLAALSLYDVDQQDAVVLNYDKEQKAFVKDDKKFAINKDGSVVIEESDLNDLGITYLNKIILSGSNYGIQKEGHIDVYGFSDAALGKESITSVTTDNYLDGIQKEAYKVSAKDDSMFLTSKMYFDATITAGYKDSETEGGDRFDETATSREHVRKEYYTTNSSAAGSFLDDSELDVGYKAIGSYMVDFRQYLNAGTNYPTDPTRNNYYSQEMQGMNYVYTQSYNTAADVKMSVNLPSDEFETYYLKVDPRAKDYYQKIVVHYKDGTSTEIDQEDWKNNALETSSTGEKFFRINLMNADEENYYSNDESDYFKQAANYQIPENPVTGIDIYLRINEEESTNSADGSKIAKNPDYGTWYVANDQKTKYMFEITGRFYETGTAKATLSSDVTIGGDQLGNSATRTGVKAKERTNSEPTSTWSYNNQYIYHYYSGWAWHTGTALYDAQHLDSSVYVNVQHDNNEVLKGVQGNPNTEENLNVTYGEEYDYDVSFYRQGNGGDTDYKTGQDLTNWRYEDAYDWKNKISFADQIVLEDTLPLVHRDTTDQVSEYKGFLTKNIRVSDELYQYMDTIEITTQHVDENANKTAGQTITLSKEDIAESANNYHAINLKYTDLNETSGKDNEILLAHDEYVKSYRITLKNIPGSADYAREYSKHYSTMDAHGTASESDIKVGGNVYSIRDVDDKATYATNTISETTYADKGNPDQPAKIRNSNDSAAMMGYRIPFKAGFNIDSLNDRRIYDYQTDNLTPNSASFGVEIFNNGDGTATDGSQNAAHIKEATVTNTLNENYRLKTINIPKEFIDGDWFEVKQLTLYFSNQAVIISKNDLESYLTADGDTYHFDINGYIRNNVEKFPTYSVNNSDATYVKEQIKSFQIIFSAKNPIRNQESTILDASQYIPADKAKGYAFTYDGVYVDRTESDIEKNAWTLDSRPTYINQPNRFDDDYSSNDLYNDVDVKFVSSDMNAQNYGGNISGTDTRDYYELLNRVANMVVDLDRGTDINGTISFAYDQISNEESSSNDRLAVDRNHLIPDDYIEYTLTLGADTDSTIDLAKMYAHFEAPTGMRIIGWKIVSNDTGIEDDAITATAMEANGSAWDTLDKDKLYSINAGDFETNYKNLSISVGDKEEQSWVQAGKKIKIVVITQLTNEISDFEGKTITPVYEAAAEPVHTYSQYRVYRDGDRSDASNNAGITTPYTSNGDINFYHGFAAFFNDSNEHTHISRITSTVNFMDSNDLQIDYTFDDSIKHYDHQPMTMKVYGKNPTDITNDTQHPLDEATFEISFLSEQNGKLYKGFDLTEKPAFSYPSNMDSTDSEPIKIEYCYLESNTKDASDGEYIKNDVTENWVSEENVVVNESDLSDGKYLLKDAVKIRLDILRYSIFGNR